MTTEASMRSHVSGAPKNKTKGAPAKPDHKRNLAQKELRALRRKARRPCNHHVLEIQEAWFQAEWAWEKLTGAINFGYPGLYVPWCSSNRPPAPVVSPSPSPSEFHMFPDALPTGPLEDLFVEQEVTSEVMIRRSLCAMDPPFPFL
jgi:hypothetical protein